MEVLQNCKLHKIMNVSFQKRKTFIRQDLRFLSCVESCFMFNRDLTLVLYFMRYRKLMKKVCFN